MSQSEYETITCSQCKAQENVHMQVAIGFASCWLKKWQVSFAGQSQSEAMQIQSKINYHLMLKWKQL